MTMSKGWVRMRAAGTVLLLLLSGAVAGIAVDRLWFSAPVNNAGAMPLTADAMAAQLGLSADEEARLTALLDTLNAEMAGAMAGGSEALMTATHAAHLRIEASLPPEARSAFHAWMREQHERMMLRMHQGGMVPEAMGSGVMHP